MAFWTHRRATRSESDDLVTRVHRTALQTPDTLQVRQLPKSHDNHSQAYPDSSSSDDDLPQPSPGSRQHTHTRSMSQPFPALFTSKKKSREFSADMLRQAELDKARVRQNRLEKKREEEMLKRARSLGAGDADAGDA